VIGRRFLVPHPTRVALERVFEAPVEGIIVMKIRSTLALT
jgi:hypothetical protein